MAFKRALWKSGLIYERTCERCRHVFRYMDDQLDFRPWYADGFVYCPRCQTPLRHSELLAVATADGQPISTTATMAEPVAAPKEETVSATTEPAAFCSGCGTPYREGDNFCSRCGKKR